MQNIFIQGLFEFLLNYCVINIYNNVIHMHAFMSLTHKFKIVFLKELLYINNCQFGNISINNFS